MVWRVSCCDQNLCSETPRFSFLCFYEANHLIGYNSPTEWFHWLITCDGLFVIVVLVLVVDWGVHEGSCRCRWLGRGADDNWMLWWLLGCFCLSSSLGEVRGRQSCDDHSQPYGGVCHSFTSQERDHIIWRVCWNVSWRQCAFFVCEQCGECSCRSDRELDMETGNTFGHST